MLWCELKVLKTLLWRILYNLRRVGLWYLHSNFMLRKTRLQKWHVCFPAMDASKLVPHHIWNGLHRLHNRVGEVLKDETFQWLRFPTISSPLLRRTHTVTSPLLGLMESTTDQLSAWLYNTYVYSFWIKNHSTSNGENFPPFNLMFGVRPCIIKFYRYFIAENPFLLLDQDSSLHLRICWPKISNIP